MIATGFSVEFIKRDNEIISAEMKGIYTCLRYLFVDEDLIDTIMVSSSNLHQVIFCFIRELTSMDVLRKQSRK